ncbi:MAG: pitrilysin family protein [Bacteroidota bacterium]|nr:pitrilysin family protein [Bacteroidota bacterium]
MEPLIHTLSNGLRIVHLPQSGRVSHVGLFVRAGTRDEHNSGHQGIAHFIEHVIFKGTAKRNVFQVLNRLENVGADLNAYTTKEDTCIYASFLNEYYDRTLELISDITLHSVFPEKELEKEKQVVIDEIHSYEDSPSDLIFDEFEDQLFEGHPLGRNILGTVQGVRRFNRTKVGEFMQVNYIPDHIVIASVGNISFEKLVRLAEKYFTDIPYSGKPVTRQKFNSYSPTRREKKKKVYQTHCIIGSPGYPFTDPRRISLALLNNLLGGPTMNSRLSLALRERNGLTYQNEAAYTPYSDTGNLSIYFSTVPQFYERAHEIVMKELKKLRDEKLKLSQLNIARRQLSGQIAISRESGISNMLSMGKCFLMQDRFDSFEMLLNLIQSITAEELQEIACEVFDPENLSELVYQPR